MERLEDALVANPNSLSVNSFQNGEINSLINPLSGNNGGGGGAGGGGQNNSVNSNSMNINSSNANGLGASLSSTTNLERTNYTIPGILHYLQHEWNRYELDRQQWEVEKTELMTKISFLQGERRGQENLKQNLIRRIKMLELALKQERTKYNKLKYGNESGTNDSKQSASNTIDDPFDIENGTFLISQHPILNKENNANSSNSFKHGRQILKQYLQEIGYTENIIDIRSSRLRSLLGLKANAGLANNASNQFQDPIDILTASANSRIDQLTNILNNNNNANSSAKQQQLFQVNATKKFTQQPVDLDSNGPTHANSNGIMTAKQNHHQSNDFDSSQVNGNKGESEANSMLLMSNMEFNNGNTSTSTMIPGLPDSARGNRRKIMGDDNDDDEEYTANQQGEKHFKSKNIFNVGSEQQQDQQNGSAFTSESFDANKQFGQLVDADTEDALKEFSFLSNDSSYADDSAVDWNVDKAQLMKLTEQYKMDRKTTKNMKQQQQQQQNAYQNENASINSQRPNRTALQAMISNLSEESGNQQRQQNQTGGTDSYPSSTSASSTSTGSSVSITNSNQQMNNLNLSKTAKLFLEDDSFGSDANLGELSRISVNNNVNNGVNIGGVNDETIIESNAKKMITSKFSLRGHFDAVRCLAFHPTESVLISGSEDQTIKLWNLDKSAISNKKNVNTDLEPVYTFRKHSGPVLSVLLSTNGDHLISAGLDSNIFIWNMPNFETADQYDAYSSSIFAKKLNGHTDAVWGMAMNDNLLLSISADSTVRVWNPFDHDEFADQSPSFSKSCINENKEEGVPTSIDFIHNDKSRFVTSFNAGHHNIYDLETSKIITKLSFAEPQQNTHCYKVISSTTGSGTGSSSSLVISAHEDKKIRFFDLNSGKLVCQMVAHQDACTYLAIDPSNFYLLSASHDCSLRLWNLENKNCVQEITSHRKKYDESIHCVEFHPSKPYIASGGADAIVKIFV